MAAMHNPRMTNSLITILFLSVLPFLSVLKMHSAILAAGYQKYTRIHIYSRTSIIRTRWTSKLCSRSVELELESDWAVFNTRDVDGTKPPVQISRKFELSEFDLTRFHHIFFSCYIQ